MHVSFIRDLDHHGTCPNCHANWDNGSIFETLREQEWCRQMGDAELQAHIEEFYSPPYRWSRLIGIETESYDGVSFWRCPECAAQWSNFSD